MFKGITFIFKRTKIKKSVILLEETKKGEAYRERLHIRT